MPGADFPWLAANVIKKTSGQPLLPATSVHKIGKVRRSASSA